MGATWTRGARLSRPTTYSWSCLGDGRPSLGGGAALFALGAEYKPSEVSLAVAVAKASMPWSSAEEAAEFFRRGNADYAGYRERAFSPATVDGEPAFELVYDVGGELADGTKVAQTIRLLILIHEGRTYLLSVGALSETYEEQTEQLDRFLRSVTFS